MAECIIRYKTHVVPDIPNTNNILKSIGHRCGHQSGLDESSGQHSTIFQNGFMCRVDVMFSKICEHINPSYILTKTIISKQGMSLAGGPVQKLAWNRMYIHSTFFVSCVREFGKVEITMFANASLVGRRRVFG